MSTCSLQDIYDRCGKQVWAIVQIRIRLWFQTLVDPYINIDRVRGGDCDFKTRDTEPGLRYIT